ncbi:serine hydrolase [bacterium]|nr:serine hydrolase [bacterium]
MKKTLLLLALSLNAAARPLSPAELQTFETYAEEARKAWGTPGMAVALIADNQVIYTHGFGTRSLQGPAVTAETLFQIGSASKSFTSSLVALQVQAGKLNWDDKVIDHVPEFRMFDPWVTRQFTIEDTMSQRSGQPSYATDVLAFLGADRPTIVKALREVRPVSSFRTRFAYVNNLWLVAARAVENCSSKSWEQTVAEQIFSPLAMKDTNTGSAGLYKNPNHATPHQGLKGSLQPLEADWPYADWVYTYGPAGGINSNVNDMAKYVRMQLGATPLIKTENLKMMHAPHILAFDGAQSPPQSIGQVGMMSYCLGWLRQEMSPTPLVWHNGGTSGCKTVVGFTPETGMGIVVLSNYGSTELPEALMYRYYDLYHGRPEYDYSEAFRAHHPAAPPPPARPAHPRPPAELAQYAGSYRHPVYGICRIEVDGPKLVARLGKMRLELSPWEGDTFSYPDPMDRNSPPGFASFSRKPEGSTRELRLDLADDVLDGRFIRLSE